VEALIESNITSQLHVLLYLVLLPDFVWVSFIVYLMLSSNESVEHSCNFNYHCFSFFQQERVDATAEVSKTFNEKIRKYCDMTLLSCAYAGTGNVLKVFYLIHLMMLLY